jgi:peptidoglycan/LPS O-acetylase OafA/YrhL
MDALVPRDLSTAMPRIDQNTSNFIACSRWIAAFLVLVSHAARLIYGDSPFILLDLGHEAVIVFFVVSGYLVGGINLSRWLQHGVTMRDYGAARIARIYTVFLPALVFGAMLDLCGMHWFNGHGLYDGELSIRSIDPVEPRITPTIFVANLLMLGGVRTVTLGTNGPLWSLPYEWFYYCLFVCAIAAALKRSILCGVASIVLLAIMPMQMIIYSLIWMIGVATYFLRAHIPWPIGISILITVVTITRLPVLSDAQGTIWTDILVASAYAIALLSSTKLDLGMHRFHEWAASFSFSMYLVHFPLLVFLFAIGVKNFTLLVAIAVIASYVFSRLTEVHTDTVRHYVTRIMTTLPFR